MTFSYGTMRRGTLQEKMIYTIMAAASAFITCVSAADPFSYRDGGENKKEWNPVSAGPVTTWTAPLCSRGHMVVQPFFVYNRTRGTFDADGHYDPLPGNDEKSQYQEQLFIQYGLTDRVEISGQAVYQQNWRRQDEGSARADGFGDSYLFARCCVVEEKERVPHVTGLFQLKLPTGKYQKAAPDKLGMDLMGAASGGGSYDHGYGINLSKKAEPFVFHADGAWSFPIETRVDGVKTRYGIYQNYDAGIELFLPKGFNLLAECNLFLQGDRKEDGVSIPASSVSQLMLAFGIGWSCDAVQTLFVYQRIVAGRSIDANDSAVFTFVYAF